MQTVALSDSEISDAHRQIWHCVRSAQTIAHHTAHSGALTRKVDEAARAYLKVAGYDSYFTHRLGHGETFLQSAEIPEMIILGIGLEVHERPYLRGGSNDVIKSGHAFSNEPGIYIEGKVRASLRLRIPH